MTIQCGRPSGWLVCATAIRSHRDHRDFRRDNDDRHRQRANEPVGDAADGPQTESRPAPGRDDNEGALGPIDEPARLGGDIAVQHHGRHRQVGECIVAAELLQVGGERLVMRLQRFARVHIGELPERVCGRLNAYQLHRQSLRSCKHRGPGNGPFGERGFIERNDDGSHSILLDGPAGAAVEPLRSRPGPVRALAESGAPRVCARCRARAASVRSWPPPLSPSGRAETGSSARVRPAPRSGG